MGGGFSKEKTVNLRHCSKLIHEGEYVAEVDIDLIVPDEGWSPYISMSDAYKLDDVRLALRQGDVKSASKLARIYTLTPIAV